MTTIVSAVWASLRMSWWYGLWRLRPVGRVLLARLGVAAYAVMARNVWHWMVANIFTIALAVVVRLVLSWGLLPWSPSTRTTVYVAFAWAALVQVLFVMATNGGAPARLMMRFWVCRAVFGWKLAWRFRSRWPMEWAIPANKTRAVQAEVGNTSEATVTIRPVFDAPKLSWWPQIDWPTISWLVSPPPGRTFAQFDAMVDVLASNIANVVEVTLDYERASSSVGRLTVLFDDPLAVPILPDGHIGDDPLSPAEAGVAEVIDLRPRISDVGAEVEF